MLERVTVDLLQLLSSGLSFNDKINTHKYSKLLVPIPIGYRPRPIRFCSMAEACVVVIGYYELAYQVLT